MTQSLGGVEARAPVQQAAVVEHHEVARLQEEADLELRSPQALIELTARAEVGVELLGREERHEVQARAEVDGLHGAGDVELDRRRTGG